MLRWTSSLACSILSLALSSSTRAAEDPEDFRLLETRVEEAFEKSAPATVSLLFPGRTENQGSGVVVRADGLILTAAHVIHLDLDRPESYEPGRSCTVTLADGRRFRGHSLGILTEPDCGLVQIDEPPDDLPVAEMGDDRDHRAGDWCLALGHPGGIQRGRPAVLRLGRLQASWGRSGFLRTDCVITTGDSGGPLLDLDGKVIGIHSRIQESQSRNFHARVSSFLDGWEGLISAKPREVSRADPPFVAPRARLGIKVQDAEPRGAKIVQVVEGGTGDRAGLEVGDVVLEVAGESVEHSGVLLQRVFAHDPADDLSLVVLRDGVRTAVTVRFEGGSTP